MKAWGKVFNFTINKRNRYKDELLFVSIQLIKILKHNNGYHRQGLGKTDTFVDSQSITTKQKPLCPQREYLTKNVLPTRRDFIRHTGIKITKEPKVVWTL